MIGDTDIKQLFTRDFDELPTELKLAIETASPLEKLLEIGRKNNLRIDQIGALGEIVNEFILGYISAPGEFVSEIKTRLDADDEKSRVIAKDINTEIFLLIREALKKITTAPASPAPKPLPPMPPEPMEKAEPMIFPPGAADRVKKSMIEEAKSPVPARMEDVKIPGPKAEANGKISPIISRIGIQRTAEKGTGDQALGARKQGTEIAMPIIEEVKQQKVVAPAPAAESPAPPSAKPSLYDEIKARAEREMKELIEKERGGGAGGQATGANAGAGDRTPGAAPSPAAKPATPPTPKPLKLPQEKIPKPQAPERYSTDPYRESVE